MAYWNAAPHSAKLSPWNCPPCLGFHHQTHPHARTCKEHMIRDIQMQTKCPLPDRDVPKCCPGTSCKETQVLSKLIVWSRGETSPHKARLPRHNLFIFFVCSFFSLSLTKSLRMTGSSSTTTIYPPKKKQMTPLFGHPESTNLDLS